MKKKIIISAIVLIFIAVIVVLNFTRGEKAVEVQAEKVQKRDITQTVTGNGKIYPVTEVKISARVQGKIMALTVDEGDSVKAGQVLIRLEQKQYQAALDRATSSLLGAQANLKLAKSELSRARQLFEQNLASKADLEIAQAKYEQALSQMQQAEATVKEAKDALERTVIASPIDGVVIQKNKEVGEIALGSQFQEDVILVVADLSEMEARIEVNENDIVNVTEGDTAFVEIDAYPDTSFTGIVTEIANSGKTKGLGTMEEVTNFEVKIRLLDRLPGFRPGMSTTADIATETHRDVLAVPIQSVTVRERPTLKQKEGVEERKTSAESESRAGKKRRDEMIEVVFVVEDGVATMRPVKLGISDDNYYEIRSGVSEGEMVVTGPFKILNRTLKDGEKVKIKEEKKLASRR